MLRICIGELVEQVGGTLTFGSLPPLAGRYEPIRRIVVDSRVARPGDVFWGLEGPTYQGAHFAEEAFLRGAMGVVIEGRHVEPWAGRFSLRVPDANTALLRLSTARAGRLRKRRHHNAHGTTTDKVEALLSGQPISLPTLIEGLQQQLAMHSHVERGVSNRTTKILEVPPTVS
jgi:hypothetical protein